MRITLILISETFLWHYIYIRRESITAPIIVRADVTNDHLCDSSEKKY